MSMTASELASTAASAVRPPVDEANACECYRIVRTEYDRVLEQPAM